jgi:hypothetical protein
MSKSACPYVDTTSRQVGFERAEFMVDRATPVFTELTGQLPVIQADLFEVVASHRTDLGLVDFATVAGQRLMDKDAWTSFPARLALQSLHSELGPYLSTDPAHKKRVERLAVRDGLRFGLAFTSLMAESASEVVAAAGERRSAVELLRADDFHAVLEDLATTSFGFYGNGLVGGSLESFEFNVLNRLRRADPRPNSLRDIIKVDSSGAISVSPDIRMYLAVQMKAQNQLRNQPIAGSQSIGLVTPSGILTTSGCPAARRVSDEKPSAIAQYSIFLADQYEAYQKIGERRYASVANRIACMMSARTI